MNYNPNENPIIIKCKAADSLPIDLILEFQGNLKRLTQKNREKLIASICLKGFIAPVFVWDNRGDYQLLDGHQRIKTLIWMRQKGWNIPNIPVVYVEAENEKDAREKLLNITSQYGEFDMEELNEWVSECEEELQQTLRLVDEELELSINSTEEVETVGDDDMTEEVEPVTKLGDLWELGEHRLLCGDSTDKETATILCGNTMMDSFVTDPPYNVDYVGKTKDALTIKNDKMNEDAFRAFLKDAYTSANSVMKPGAVFYIWFADCETHNFTGALKDVGWPLRQMIIWKKNSLVMGRKDYHFIHEPCLYGWKDGAGHLWASDRKQTTIINIDRPSRSEEHPTMKPVPLFEYCILNNTKEMDAVLDTFAGSGTTLIACEKNNRHAYLMELDPHYCDVIVNRYKTWCENNGREPIIKLNGEIWNGEDGDDEVSKN